MTRVARHLAAWLALWAVCFWGWLLLVGEWNRTELVAAALTATAAASFGERARAVAGLRFRIPLRELPSLPTALAMVPVDFCILVWLLVRGLLRRELPRGRFVVRELGARGDDAVSVGRRAWTTWAASFSPNAYVVDMDREGGTVLLHDLVPLRKSEEPAGS